MAFQITNGQARSREKCISNLYIHIAESLQRCHKWEVYLNLKMLNETIVQKNEGKRKKSARATGEAEQSLNSREMRRRWLYGLHKRKTPQRSTCLPTGQWESLEVLGISLSRSLLKKNKVEGKLHENQKKKKPKISVQVCRNAKQVV